MERVKSPGVRGQGFQLPSAPSHMISLCLVSLSHVQPCNHELPTFPRMLAHRLPHIIALYLLLPGS